MKRVLILLLSAVLMTAALTGCSSGEEDALVSKTPFPEFSEVDIAGDEISSDIFADYDATIVNFWNNGCGSCIAEMPELEELYQDFKERNINLIGVGTELRREPGAAGHGPGDFEGKGRDLSQVSLRIRRAISTRTSLRIFPPIPLHISWTARETSWVRISWAM